jgi:curli biogenesis system outer membrane secretion channel CsgG
MGARRFQSLPVLAAAVLLALATMATTSTAAASAGPKAGPGRRFRSSGPAPEAPSSGPSTAYDYFTFSAKTATLGSVIGYFSWQVRLCGALRGGGVRRV